jgi:hypothetical protein
MRDKRQRVSEWMAPGRVGLFVIAAVFCTVSTVAQGGAAPSNPHLTEYRITIDPTSLHPPTWWYVPGVTPAIMSMDPDTTEALRTTSSSALALKPGSYRFGTFTFDFPFVVTLEGVLDFAPSLDECVSGRGTRTLTVRCSRTQPYSGQRDY